MPSFAEKNLLALTMTLITAYRSLAASWHSLGPSAEALDDLVADTRRNLKSMHSEHTMSDADEIAAVEIGLTFFDQVLKPEFLVDTSRDAPDLDPGRAE